MSGEDAMERLKGLSAVYVEDNAINVQLMETIFEDIDDASLAIATNGEDSIQIIADVMPDVILMDIGLPGMDGIETTAQLKSSETTRDIPVIAISAAAMNSDLERAESVGFFAYLTKPINIPDTLRTIILAMT